MICRGRCFVALKVLCAPPAPPLPLLKSMIQFNHEAVDEWMENLVNNWNSIMRSNFVCSQAQTPPPLWIIELIIEKVKLLFFTHNCMRFALNVTLVGRLERIFSKFGSEQNWKHIYWNKHRFLRISWDLSFSPITLINHVKLPFLIRCSTKDFSSYHGTSWTVDPGEFAKNGKVGRFLFHFF